MEQAAGLAAAVNLQPLVDASSSLINALPALLGAVVGAVGMWLVQRQAYRDRLRLEREYLIYTELWDRLYVLRQQLGARVKWLGRSDEPEEEALRAFNLYQSELRKHQPFIPEDIYDPARNLTGLARDIMDKTSAGTHADAAKYDAHAERRGEPSGQLGKVRSEAKQDWEKFEQLFSQVLEAIRKRLKP